MRIAVDFDKTLHLGEWPAIGIPAPDAIEVMKKLKKDGHYLIIWTCRSGDDERDAVNWLLEKGIPFDRVNDNHPEDMVIYGNSSRKINADIHIDDKNLGGLPPWREIYEIISNL